MHHSSEQKSNVWLGDVWKAVAVLRSDPKIDIITGDFDMGMALIKIRKSSYPNILYNIAAHSIINELNYKFLNENRQELLLLHTFNDIVNWL